MSTATSDLTDRKRRDSAVGVGDVGDDTSVPETEMTGPITPLTIPTGRTVSWAPLPPTETVESQQTGDPSVGTTPQSSREGNTGDTQGENTGDTTDGTEAHPGKAPAQKLQRQKYVRVPTRRERKQMHRKREKLRDGLEATSTVAQEDESTRIRDCDYTIRDGWRESRRAQTAIGRRVRRGRRYRKIRKKWLKRARRYGSRDKLLRKIVRGIFDREEGKAEPTSRELEKMMLYWEYGVVFKDDDSGYETDTGESSS